MTGRIHKLITAERKTRCGFGMAEVKENQEKTTIRWAAVTCMHCINQRLGRYS